MNKTLLLTATVAALVLSGCAKKSPEVDLSNKAGTALERAQANVQNVYFDFDKYNIRADMNPVLSANAGVLNQPDVKAVNIKVEGNCDEWGSDEYNYALGLKRAKAVKDNLVSKGVDANRISVVSYGESNPVCTDRNEVCDAKNRRAEFKLSY